MKRKHSIPDEESKVMAPRPYPGGPHNPRHRNLDELDAGTGCQDPSFENSVRLLEDRP